MGGRQGGRGRRLAVAGAVALWVLGGPVAEAQVMLRRDWWFRAPGGNYGLMEVRTVHPVLGPEHAVSRTTVLMGPWRRTFEATAPQVTALVVIPALVTAFTWGWIKTRRR